MVLISKEVSSSFFVELLIGFVGVVIVFVGVRRNLLHVFQLLLTIFVVIQNLLMLYTHFLRKWIIDWLKGWLVWQSRLRGEFNSSQVIDIIIFRNIAIRCWRSKLRTNKRSILVGSFQKLGSRDSFVLHWIHLHLIVLSNIHPGGVELCRNISNTHVDPLTLLIFRFSAFVE